MERLPEFVANHWLLFLALAAVLALLAHSFLAPHLRRYREVGPLEATTLINREDAVVVDVREGHEYREGHIPGSVHMPLSRLRRHAEELDGYRGRPVIVVCRSGSRSSSACGILAKHGHGPLYHLGGGMLAWERANLPVSRR